MSAPEDPLTAAKDLLCANGYLVVKIPPCKKAGTGHAKHILLTKSLTCPGEEPIPHMSLGRYTSFLGGRVLCACGDSFSDAYWSDDPDEKTDWELHKELHAIV